MDIVVRKIVRQLVETFNENGQPVEPVHRVAIVAAVIANPYPAHYVADLLDGLDEAADEVGGIVGPATVDLLGEPVEAFGKAALVGIDGEVEHGSALIHNLRFGNRFREAADGTELLPAAEKVGFPGAPIDIAIKHKTDAKTRSHHQTVTFQIADAPLPGEIVVLCAAVNRGRPLARLADFGSEVAHDAE